MSVSGKWRFQITAVGTILNALLMAGPVFAQSAENSSPNASPSVPEIVVTAQRREQALQDVPLTVSAVSSEALQARSVVGLSDFANGSIPGMQIMPFAGNASVLAINSRGVGISDPTQGTQELAVPLYIDGVPLGRAQGLGLELIEPERVEFLRGPQGQLFGRNAEGGAIQFVSRRPSGELGFDASAQFGNYGLDHQKVRVDLPEFANIRLQGTFIHTQHDAYTKNTPKGVYSEQADYAASKNIGFRIAAEWNPTSDIRVNYTYDYSDLDESQPYPVWVPVDILGRTPFSPQPAFDGDYPSVVNSPTYNQMFKTKSSGHALTIQYNLSDPLTFKSITSYRQMTNVGSSTLGDALVAGGSSTGVLRPNAFSDIDQHQWYQEIQLIGSWDHFNITTGGTYFFEKAEDERRSYITGPGLTSPALGINPATLRNCVGLEKCMTSRSDQNAKTDSFGFYAQGTYTPPILDERLELTAGVRYSDDKKVARRTYIQPAALPPFTDATPSGPLPPVSEFQAKRWDPAFVVKYSFTHDLNVYARYATAYRAGGANVRSTNFESYGAEEVEAIEIGLKARGWGNRFTFNAAYYHNNIKNQQANIQEAPTTNPSLTNTVNLDRPFKVDGVEAEATLRPIDGLTLSAGYSYMHAKKFVEFDNPLTTAVDITRFYSVQTPKHSGNVAVDYELPIKEFAKLAFHADYAFSSSFWTTPGGLLVASLGPNYERPATKTSMLNGRIALKDIQTGPVKAEIAVFGKNLLNETYYTYAFDGAASGGGLAMFLQSPRTYGLEIRFHY